MASGDLASDGLMSGELTSGDSISGDSASVEPANVDLTDGGSHGDNVAARLLQAVTALYLQRSDHTAEEQQQFTELALRLIAKAPAAAQSAAAARLQGHPDTPAAVIASLADAESSHETPASHGTFYEARVEPSLSTEDPLLAEAAAKTFVESAPSPLAARPGFEDERDGMELETPQLGEAVLRQPPQVTAEFGEAFFAASSAVRLRMLAEIKDGPAAGDATESGRRFHVRIDNTPWRSRTGAVARDFARMIEAPENLSERILDDPSGEPLAVAAKATGMPVALLQRILLLASPSAHHSVQRVYELTELYHAVGSRTARALLAAWREGASDDGQSRQKTPSVPVANMRARLHALNVRIGSGTGG